MSNAIHHAEIERLHRLIEFMGGNICEQLRADVDYFITEDVWSVEEAKEAGIEQVMQAMWITKLWEINQGDEDISQHAFREIETGYRVPIFFNLTIAVTGFNNVLQLQSIIERNKGNFSKGLNKKVDILIIETAAIDNDKHRLATAWKKICVRDQWLLESAKIGYALNIEGRVDRESFILKSTGPAPYNLILNSTDRSCAAADLTTDFEGDLSRVSVANVDASVRSTRSTRHSVRDSAADGSIRSTKSEFAMPKPKSKIDNRKTLVASKSMDKQKIVLKKFLKGKKVYVLKDVLKDKKDDFILNKAFECGATLVEEGTDEEVDYVIIPGLFKPKLNLKFKKIGQTVNHYWLTDCITVNKLADIEAHHTLLEKIDNDKKPLKNEIFVVSNYRDTKRCFVKSLVESLGGEFKESLMKAESPIVICPVAEGTKYQSALSWNLTVLTLEWLIECVQNQFRANETPFLVGLSKPSKINIERNVKRSSVIPSSQEYLEFNNFSYPTCSAKSNGDIVDKDKRNAISLNSNSPCISNNSEQKVREILKGWPTPDRAIASRMLRDSTSSKIFANPKVLETKMTDEDISDSFLKIRLRPDESPDTQERHSLRLASMDKICVASNNTKPIKKPELEELEPSYKVRRYLFYKSRIPGYSSPDPRGPYYFHQSLKSNYEKQTEVIAKSSNSENQENSVDPSNFFAVQSENMDDQENSLNVPDFELSK